MAVREALLDTSVLIEHFRNKDKHTTVLFRTMHQGTLPRISVITRFEVLLGATMVQRKYWQTCSIHSLSTPWMTVLRTRRSSLHNTFVRKA